MTLLWAVLAMVAVSVIAANGREIAPIAGVLSRARWQFLAAAIVLEAVFVFNLALFYSTTFRASELRATFGRFLLLTSASHFVNLVSKTAGLAGMAMYVREGRWTGESRARIGAAYLITYALGYAAFLGVLVLALVLLYLRGSLRPAEIVASAVIITLIGIFSTTAFVAVRSETSLERLYLFFCRPVNAVARLLRRDPFVAEESARQSAAELYGAVTRVRRSPTLYGVPALHALGVELLSTALLFIVARALHANIGFGSALIAYAISLLFSMVAITPGGLGFVEASLSVLLVSFGVPRNTAIAVALAYRAFEFWLPVALGAFSLLLLRSPEVRRESIRRSPRFGRRALSVAAVALALFNILLSMFPAPLSGLGQFEGIVPIDALNGSRFVLVILGMLLLSSAIGLWQGKRAAWAVALACALGSALAHPLKNVDLWGTLASAGFAGAMLGARSHFPARSDPPTALRGVQILVLGAVGVFLYSTLGLYFLDQQFHHPVPFGDALMDSVRLMFIVPATAVEPATKHGAWFLDSVRVAFLFVMALGVWRLWQPVIYRARTAPLERERVRDLLEHYGNTSIAFFSLLQDKAYFFSDDRRAVLVYKVVRGNAIVMGDPLGDESEFRELIERFREHCELSGWALAFHQATPRHLHLFAALGLRALKIGEEGIIPIQDFSLGGHSMKHLRSTMNRFHRECFTTVVLSPPHSGKLIERLKEISDAWLAQGNRRERTFTLGSFDAWLLQQCEVMVVRDAGGAIVAFANIIPSYNLPQGNFDMVRYGEHPKAVSDFIYLSLIDLFRKRGYSGMNLGLAPFSGINVEAAASPALRAMQLLFRHGDFLFRYEGLREYKEKFDPVWEPRYLVYGSGLQLPGIALAVAVAGESKAPPPGVDWRPRLYLREAGVAL